MRRCAEKAAAVQGQMRTCAQSPEDFDDVEALWGYAAQKFVPRARMTFDALTRRAPDSLRSQLASDSLRVAALGAGPGAELFAAAVARDVAGGGGVRRRLAVFEWVDGWQPIVDAVGALLGEAVEYHHCDVSKPLSDSENTALREGEPFDLLIFSHVLLECGRGGGAAPLDLLRDLWQQKLEIRHILVLDAGQAKGHGKRDRPLAGSLREVELLAAELGDATLFKVDGRSRTDGVLLART